METLTQVIVDDAGNARQAPQRVRGITPTELAAANNGQRPDLLAFEEVFYKHTVTDEVYVSRGGRIVIADNAGEFANAVLTVNGMRGNVVITKDTIFLDSVDNTSDLNKPLSTNAITALAGKQATLGFTPENAANKDASNGYPGLVGQALRVWNAAKTFSSIVSFTGTANRAHVLPDKAGTFAMTSDIPAAPDVSGKQDTSAKDTSGGYVGLTGFAINLWNAAKTFRSLLSFAGTANRAHVFPDKDGTVALTNDFKTVNGISLLGAGDIAAAGLEVVPVAGTSQVAVASRHYVLTNAAQTTLSLPAGVEGATIAVTTIGVRVDNSVARNGVDTIMGIAEPLVLNRAGHTVTLRYLSASWRII